jgi:hypothetical protein
MGIIYCVMWNIRTDAEVDIIRNGAKVIAEVPACSSNYITCITVPIKLSPYRNEYQKQKIMFLGSRA